MNYKKMYQSPLGVMWMCSDGKFLTGLWFEESRDSLKHEGEYVEKDLDIFKQTSHWLDIYFSGKQPHFINRIPYGKVITYNDIAKEIAKQKGINKISAQAVGGAVGWNPICIIIPCHRVVGANGSLTGYGGGIQNKINLLKLEKNDISKFIIPIKGTAL